MGLFEYLFPQEGHEDIPGDLLGSGLGQRPPRDAQPLIVVHPYFPFEPDVRRLTLQRGECVREGYVEALESLINAHDGPIITLEEDGRCMRTLRRYEDLGRSDDSYVVPTIEADPLPLRGWPALYCFLDHFTARPAVIVGGQYNPPRKHKHDSIGCLNITASMLKRRGIDYLIRKEATFSRCSAPGKGCVDISYPAVIPGKSFSSCDAY